MKYEVLTTLDASNLRNEIISRFIGKSYDPDRRLVDMCFDEIYFRQWTVKITAMGGYHGGALQFEFEDSMGTDLGFHIDKGKDQLEPCFEIAFYISILKALDKRKELNGH